MLDFLDRFFLLIDRWRRRPYRFIGPGYREYLYREGKRKVRICYESTLGDPLGDMMIDGSSLVRWASPHEDELIAQEKREQILQRFGEMLTRERTRYFVTFNPAYEEQERQAAILRHIEKQQE